MKTKVVKIKKKLLTLIKTLLICNYLIKKHNLFKRHYILSHSKKTMFKNFEYHFKRYVFVKNVKLRKKKKFQKTKLKWNYKSYSASLLNYKKKMHLLLQFYFKNTKRASAYSFKLIPKTVKYKQKLKIKEYGIIKINTQFANLNFALTTLDGKVLKWTSGGADLLGTRGTRMTSRAVNLLMQNFLKQIIQARRKKRLSIRYIKVQYTGPSKRFRAKFFNMIRRKQHVMGFSILCREDAFQRSFNGCRLRRRKRK
jgi:ribosomal protein S11